VRILKRKQVLREQTAIADAAAQEAAERLKLARAEVEPSVKSRRYNHFTEMIVDSLLICYGDKGGSQE
jgi:hypothetical protein